MFFELILAVLAGVGARWAMAGIKLNTFWTVVGCMVCVGVAAYAFNIKAVSWNEPFDYWALVRFSVVSILTFLGLKRLA